MMPNAMHSTRAIIASGQHRRLITSPRTDSSSSIEFKASRLAIAHAAQRSKNRLLALRMTDPMMKESELGRANAGF